MPIKKLILNLKILCLNLLMSLKRDKCKYTLLSHKVLYYKKVNKKLLKKKTCYNKTMRNANLCLKNTCLGTKSENFI